jgi:hypothetical protein
MVIKKQDDNAVDSFDNKQLYEIVFQQESKEDECHDAMRIATDMKILEQQKVAPRHVGIQRAVDHGQRGEEKEQTADKLAGGATRGLPKRNGGMLLSCRLL